MIRLMLGTIPKPLDDTQRENIFHTVVLSPTSYVP